MSTMPPPRKKKPGSWAARLVALRKSTKLSQAELAARVGVHVSTWVKWERGERNPSVTAAQLLPILFPDLVTD